MSSNNLNSNRPYTTYIKHDGKLDVHGLNRLNDDNVKKHSELNKVNHQVFIN